MSAPTSSLSSVVSKLTRASMGASIQPNVKDEDLDRYVADLILKEAKQAEERYKGKEGIRAYLPHTGLPESNVPKTNKRFLHSIIRNVDDHNTAILQSQAKAAEELRLQREEAERADRRARAVEASQDRLRRLMGGSAVRRRSRDRNEPSSSRPSSSSSYRDRDRDRDWDRERSRDWRTFDSDDDREHSSRPSKKRRRDGDSPRSPRHPIRPSKDEEEDSDRPHQNRSLSPPRSEILRRARSPSRGSDNSHPIDLESETDPRPISSIMDSGRSRRDVVVSSSSRTSRDRHVKSREYTDPSPSRRSHSRDRHDSGRERDRNGKRVRSHRDSRSPTPDSSSRGKRRDESDYVGPSHSHSRSHHTSSRMRDQDDSKSKKHSKHRDTPERSTKSKSKHKSKHRVEEDDDGQDDEVGPQPSGHSSKMDKYFDPAYDPALDYTPSLDINSLVADGAFDGWNTMLQIVRMRREDKEEKKRKEKYGDSPSRKHDKEGEPSVMDIKYKKRGATREWDLGKD